MTTKATKSKKATFSKIAEWLRTTAGIITSIGVVAGAIIAIGAWSTNLLLSDVNKKLDDVTAQMNDIKLDTTRAQLLTLISNYPDNESEIMKVAKYYFKDLGGDWYMTDIFVRWADSRGIDFTKIVSAGHRN